MFGKLLFTFIFSSLISLQITTAQSPHPMRPAEVPQVGTPGAPNPTVNPNPNSGAILREGERGSVRPGKNRSNPALKKRIPQASGPNVEHETDVSNSPAPATPDKKSRPQ